MQAADVAYAAVPLLLYFITMFVLSFKLSQLCGATYAQAVTLAFTAASNNFELALAGANAPSSLHYSIHHEAETTNTSFSSVMISRSCGSRVPNADRVWLQRVPADCVCAVAVGTFGLQSDEALMSVVGALIEIPTMLSLVKMAFVFRQRWTFKAESAGK